MKTARMRTAQIALAVKTYQVEHGQYPDSLAELEAEGWQLPTDPFGGGTYQYRLEGDGFVVWSIGPDMDDDQAGKDLDSFHETPDEERQRNPYDYDVIFRCER